MNHKLSPALLRSLRNEIPISEVIELYMDNLHFQNGTLRFPCPICQGSDTAINMNTNLARCFSCAQNFNPIDLVIAVRHCSFLQATQDLVRIYKFMKQPMSTRQRVQHGKLVSK